jgi:hypothetical protein
METQPSTGLPTNNAQQLLYVLRGANMQLTTDQPFTKVFTGRLFDPQSGSSIVNCKSGAFSVGCSGGVYTAASKGGTQIIASTQNYSGLTGVNAQVHPAIVANNTTFDANAVTPTLSLSTGNSAALTADFFIYGSCLD